MKTILGVDNGLHGALSFYDGAELLIYDMPIYGTDRPALDLIRIKDIININKPTHSYIEKLTPLPKISGLTAFSMGHSEGAVIATLTALQVPFTLIRPVEWKKAMQCPAEKDAARMRASQLLPAHSHNWSLKKHDGRAESALIALYGWNK
jgi:crossover junction endodeoxyribonuclease RuvC